MSETNEGLRLLREKRKKRIKELLDRTPAIDNGLEMPKNPPRFMGVEESSDSAADILWAYFEDTLSGMGHAFAESDTDGVFRYRVYDLDTNDKYVPVFCVSRWVGIPNE